MTLTTTLIEPADVKTVLEKQDQFFNSGTTKEVEWRIQQLKKLGSCIDKYELEISDALKKDLNKHPYEAYATEIGMVLKEINTATKKLKKWAKPRKVKTPPFLDWARSYVYNDPYGSKTFRIFKCHH